MAIYLDILTPPWGLGGEGRSLNKHFDYWKEPRLWSTFKVPNKMYSDKYKTFQLFWDLDPNVFLSQSRQSLCLSRVLSWLSKCRVQRQVKCLENKVQLFWWFFLQMEPDHSRWFYILMNRGESSFGDIEDGVVPVMGRVVVEEFDHGNYSQGIQ